jgi:hypothetical protein
MHITANEHKLKVSQTKTRSSGKQIKCHVKWLALFLQVPGSITNPKTGQPDSGYVDFLQ